MYSVNPVIAIMEKRRVLAARKQEIRKAADRQIAEIDEELAKLQSALDLINDSIKSMDLYCHACGGTGYETITDAAGSREEIPCRACGATGIKRTD